MTAYRTAASTYALQHVGHGGTGAVLTAAGYISGGYRGPVAPTPVVPFGRATYGAQEVVTSLSTPLTAPSFTLDGSALASEGASPFTAAALALSTSSLASEGASPLSAPSVAFDAPALGSVAATELDAPSFTFDASALGTSGFATLSVAEFSFVGVNLGSAIPPPPAPSDNGFWQGGGTPPKPGPKPSPKPAQQPRQRLLQVAKTVVKHREAIVTSAEVVGLAVELWGVLGPKKDKSR